MLLKVYFCFLSLLSFCRTLEYLDVFSSIDSISSSGSDALLIEPPTKIIEDDDKATVVINAPEIMPNIGYLGNGCDIFRSEPRPIDGGIDPGYVDAIFNMTVSPTKFRRSNDGRYSIPDAANVLECLACRFTMDVQTIQTTHDYVRTVDSQVVKGDSIKWATGQASKSYGNAGKETSQNQRTLVDASLSCLVYCAELPLFALDNSSLAMNFTEAIKNLSTTPSSINNFLERFGTHFVYSMKMGSLYWQRSTYNNLDWEKAVSAIKSIQRAAQITILNNWTDVTEEEVEKANELKKFAIARFTHRVGAPLTRERSWLDATRLASMPIALSVLPVSNLMNALMFPSDETIDVKRQAVENAIQNGQYCNCILGKGGLTGQCATMDSLDIKDVTRFVANPSSLETCASGTRFPVFGGVFVTGSAFPNIVNSKTKTNDCLAGSRYIKYSAVSVTGAAMSGTVTYCSFGQTDLEGLFGGMGSKPFYVGDCGSSNSERLYPPIDPTVKLPTFTTKMAVNVNPFTGSIDKDCPRGFTALPLASLKVGNPVSTNYNLDAGSCQMAVNVFVCFNSKEYFNGAFLGGFYTIWKTGTMRHVNPITKATTCPAGYEANLILRGNQDGNHEAYACYLKGSP